MERPSASLLLVLYLSNLFIGCFCTRIGDRAKAECKKYGLRMVECDRVLNGSRQRVPADILKFPHMTLLGYKPNDKGDDIIYNCGGSMVSPSWILTAAHCLTDKRMGPPVTVLIGTTTLEDEEQEDITQERKLKQQIIHPGYKPPAKYNDIALLELSDPIKMGEYIRIACIQTDASIRVKEAIASGFGKTKFEHSGGSVHLMDVKLDMIEQKSCNESLRSMIRRGHQLRYGIVESQICAGDLLNGGRDTCQGDSGGPLQYMPDPFDCVSTFPLYHIIGVTSFGRFCGFRNSPGVYTNVAKYIEWIEDIVWPIHFNSSNENNANKTMTE